ncbi:MAG: hypothetical protein AB3N24_00220 [Leisingera sp.]
MRLWPPLTRCRRAVSRELPAGAKYTVNREEPAGGKAQKLGARELGGTDYISRNRCRLGSGALLKPCEMPEEKVIRFVLALKVTG